MAVKSHMEIAPGLKVAAQMSEAPSDEELAFIRQTGVEYAVTWIDPAKASPQYYRSRREHFARGGIKLYGLGKSAGFRPGAGRRRPRAMALAAAV